MNGTPIFGRPGWMTSSHKEFKSTKGYRPVHLDPTTYAVVEIASEHHEVHEGHMWTFQWDEPSANTPEGHVFSILTPAHTAISKPNVHLALSVGAEKGTRIQLIEDVTIGLAGNAVTPYNMNRQSTHSCLTTIKEGIGEGVGQELTYTGGTTIYNSKVGFTDADRQGILVPRPHTEWLLGVNTQYVLHLTPDVDNVNIHLDVQFYEHRHKDSWNEADDLAIDGENTTDAGGAS